MGQSQKHLTLDLGLEGGARFVRWGKPFLLVGTVS